MRRFLIAATLLAAAAPAAAQFSDAYNFLKAVRENDMYKAQTIIRQPGSTAVNTRDMQSGDQALHIVTRKRDMNWMRFLISNGADINGRDGAGNTPLLIAAAGGFPEGVRLLIQLRAGIDTPNSAGETPLIKAVQARDTETVTALLSGGANPDKTDSIAGMSARDYAARDRRSAQLLKLMDTIKAEKAAKQVGPSK